MGRDRITSATAHMGAYPRDCKRNRRVQATLARIGPLSDPAAEKVETAITIRTDVGPAAIQMPSDIHIVASNPKNAVTALRNPSMQPIRIVIIAMLSSTHSTRAGKAKHLGKNVTRIGPFMINLLRGCHKFYGSDRPNDL